MLAPTEMTQKVNGLLSRTELEDILCKLGQWYTRARVHCGGTHQKGDYAARKTLQAPRNDCLSIETDEFV